MKEEISKNSNKKREEDSEMKSLELPLRKNLNK